MGYAKYVGRVGALAVAMGVGVAVGSTPGTALADEDTSSPSGQQTAQTDHNDPTQQQPAVAPSPDPDHDTTAPDAPPVTVDVSGGD